MSGPGSQAPGPGGGTTEPDGGRDDTRDVAAVSFVYTTALAIQTITMPLLALHLGYSKPTIGVLTAVSAVAQVFVRIGSARALRYRPDRVIITAACLMMAGAAALLAVSAALPVFVASEFLQGAGRGAFWTGSQAHVVRSRKRAVGRLAATTFVSSFGQLVGPLTAAALIPVSASLTLTVSAVVGVTAAALTVARIRSVPPVPVETRTGTLSLLHSPPVRLGCWAGLTAGGWRAMLNSYVPVLLAGSGLTTGAIGVVVAAGNGASIAGSGLSGFVGDRSRRLMVTVGAATVATGAGIVLLGIAGRSWPGAGILLVLSGWGAGVLQTLSPAVAAIAVDRSARPDAVGLTGAFRAGALFVAPLAVAGLLSVLGLVPALEVTGAAMALPAGGVLRRARAGPEGAPRPTAP